MSLPHRGQMRLLFVSYAIQSMQKTLPHDLQGQDYPRMLVVSIALVYVPPVGSLSYFPHLTQLDVFIFTISLL